MNKQKLGKVLVWVGGVTVALTISVAGFYAHPLLGIAWSASILIGVGVSLIEGLI